MLVGLALAAAGYWVFAAETEAAYDGPVVPVARGPLVISISEGGMIEPREKVVLRCEVDERSTTITFIVPEGAQVQEGDLLVQLDASVLTDELYDEEIDVLDTEADFLAAGENLEVVKNQAKADVSQAELALRFAREDVKQYIEGEYPKQLLAASNSVKLAEEELEQARNRKEWSEKLFAKGFLSGSEMDKDRLAFQRARRCPTSWQFACFCCAIPLALMQPAPMQLLPAPRSLSFSMQLRGRDGSLSWRRAACSTAHRFYACATQTRHLRRSPSPTPHLSPSSLQTTPALSPLMSLERRQCRLSQGAGGDVRVALWQPSQQAFHSRDRQSLASSTSPLCTASRFSILLARCSRFVA